MKSLTGRVALAFLCVIFFLMLQGGYSIYNQYTLTHVHDEAHQKQGRIKSLRWRLDSLRLVVYKLVGTMNPDEMDRLRGEFVEGMNSLASDLIASGIDPELVEKNRSIYRDIIDNQYDFAVKTARRLINSESKTYHEQLVAELNLKDKSAEKQMLEAINSGRRRGVTVSWILGIAGLLTAAFWAVVLIRTVTDRSEAEAAISRERKRLQSLLENLPGLVYLVRSDGTVFFANRKFTEVVGELGSGVYSELERGNRLPFEDDMIRQVLQQGRNVEKDWAGPDERTYHIYSYVFTDVDDAKVILNVGHDITERKRAEKALAESEAFHRALFEQSAMPTFLQDFSRTLAEARRIRESGVSDLKAYLEENPDEAGRLAGLILVTRVNQAGMDLFRANSMDDVSGSLSRLLQPDDIGHVVDQIVAFEKGELLFEGEGFNVTSKGDQIDVIIRKNAIGGLENNYSQVLATVTDVTELHQAHKEKALLESHLQQALKMEAIGRFAGGIAHDFNNVLSAMLGYTELLLLDAKPESQEYDNLEQIMKAGRRAQAMVMQILNFSRQGESEFKIIDLSSIIHEAANLLSVILPSTIELRMNIENESSPILGDPTQIHQILMNLCGNADFAMRHKGGFMDISLANIDMDASFAEKLDLSPGKYCRLQVRDTGQGMDRETMERVFDPFFTTKETGEGTGMGLAAVYGIVNKHRGAVTVESDLGKGSTFTVYLPVVDTDLAPLENQPPAEASPGSERILFVDDESALVELGAEILKRYGYSVAGMESSSEALEYFRENHREIDLVITDYTMPKMTGLEMAEKMFEIRPEIPIVLCTGFSHELSEEAVLSAGIKRFMFKPLNYAETIRVIRDVLENHDA